MKVYVQMAPFHVSGALARFISDTNVKYNNNERSKQSDTSRKPWGGP